MSLAQLKNTGDLEATEFSEISYAGKGDGSSIYIDTGIPANTIDNFEIVFKLTYPVSGTYRQFGAYTDSNNQIIYRTTSTNNHYLTLPAPNIVSYQAYSVPNNSILKFILTKNGLVINTKLYYYNSNILILEANSTILETQSLSNRTLYLFANDVSTFQDPINSEIYSFTINNETWYINKGNGSTITGSLGTVLTVNGTLTNFWQQSEFWNEDANLKMYNTGMVKCNEFNEVATTYAGTGDGSSIYIDTGIPANTIDNFEIVFKHEPPSNTTFKMLLGARGSLEHTRCYVGMYSTNILRFGFYNQVGVFDITGVLTVGQVYRCVVWGIISKNINIRVYNLLDNLIATITYTVVTTDTISTNNIYVYRLNDTFDVAPYYTNSTIYSFTINNETWNIDRGYGNTITGTLGTVLNISALNNNIFDFWQIKESTVQQYCGKFNNSYYINTGISPKDIYYLKIRKTYNKSLSSSFSHGVLADANAGNTHFMIYAYNLLEYGSEYLYLGALGPIDVVAGLEENKIYDYELTYISGNSYNWKITDMNGVSKRNVTINGNRSNIDLMTKTFWIGRGNSGGAGRNKVYSFQINDETWYINNGTGNTITGDKGTVLTISNYTTSFWQPSEIWNDPAQMKLLETELDIQNEIVEI